MLRIYDSPASIDADKLMQVYHGSGLSLGKQREFCDSLYSFFSVPGAVYAVWEEDGIYKSALRVEPYCDGAIIAGLETHQDARCLGYATMLLSQTVAAMNWNIIYSHVSKGNGASMRVHLKCGFRQVMDHAVFLDGSVSQSYVTLRKDKK